MPRTDGKLHTDLYLIRHGETDSNVNGLLHGFTDVPLNATGRRQAELIAQRVSEMPHLDRIIASPLQRALHTAEAIVRVTGLPLEIHEGLREMNFGDAEGEPFERVGERYPEISYRFLDPSDLDVRYPNGESRREFFARIESTIDEIATRYLGEDLVLVSHGGLISATLTLLVKEHPNNWRDRPIKNTSLTHIELASEGPMAHLINDAVHLDQVDLSVEPVPETFGEE